MNSYYPIMIKLEGKKVVVIGGGKVAERKVTGLLETGAQIFLVTPEATPELQRLAQEEQIIWHKRNFLETDLMGAFMIFAATNDSQLNQHIKNVAQPYQLVIIVDDPKKSDFHVPARLQRGKLTIAVSTSGANPTLAKRICKQLEQQFDEKYKDYLEFLFLKRQWILKEIKEPILRRKLLTAMAAEEFMNNDDFEEAFWRLYKQICKADT
ncbi:MULTISPECIES: bifunctional precorrin-2 dehydrogenase/sirohydrochlorin ferrochelatase [Neobacillus]|jgi:precorrin-2 dehydrogenase / sirohydrochlorin ferrochelatase|uniref:precorrin-2 dehydrogenase/sirohydrochlorin ferrochelatase family protein n=1 Tax=Neobacillus TaxID=2675232 RepID=UPI0004F9276B|nr:NAD(P)-dependent oxidoreductase [Neobacillus sedimentimangrovi]AIM16838.1 siroheme synthase [Bacillus sp. X1(2014)]